MSISSANFFLFKRSFSFLPLKRLICLSFSVTRDFGTAFIIIIVIIILELESFRSGVIQIKKQKLDDHGDHTGDHASNDHTGNFV